MKKYIAEDLPVRKHPQAQLHAQSNNQKDDSSERSDGKDKSPEDKIRQAVYDIRYRARRENIPLRSAYSQYMQNTSMGESEKSEVRKKLFGDGGMKAEDFDMKSFASDTVATALYKVFVEKKDSIIDETQLKNRLEEASQGNAGQKKYKVRVTDKNGTSYVRYATREKINSLRANPNIQSVEMTEYGEPYEGEKSKGEQTTAAKSGKDWDGDGKKESKAKEYRGVVHNAIQKRRGGTPDGKDTSNVKESFFIGEVNATANLPQVDSTSSGSLQKTQIDVLPPKVKNKIVVNPTNTVLSHKEHSGEIIVETGYKKFLNMIQEKTLTAKQKKKKEKVFKGLNTSELSQQYPEKSPEEIKNLKYAISTSVAKKVAEEKDDVCHDNESKDKSNESDPRSIPTKVNLVKNKLRSMGLKMDFEPEGELIDERRREEKGKPRSKRNRAVELVRSQNKEGMMTRGGRTIAQHESERGVSEKDRPKKDEETTSDRLAAKKQRKAALVSARERSERDEERRRRLG